MTSKTVAFIPAEPGWYSIEPIYPEYTKAWKTPILCWVVEHHTYPEGSFHQLTALGFDNIGDDPVIMGPNGCIHKVAETVYDNLDEYLAVLREEMADEIAKGNNP